jgi:4-alpha-glucanotransferase
LGPPAYEFADFLARAGQRWWQMLPIGPVGAGFSPYDSPSSFAGSELLINLDDLAQLGLLSAKDLQAPSSLSRSRVADYKAATRFREARLRRAYERFDADLSSELADGFEQFVEAEQEWLDDYALFRALQRANKGHHFTRWDVPLRAHKRIALARARTKLAREYRYHQFLQFLFDRQWKALRSYCHERGLLLLGDVPMFVAHDGADVWANQGLFLLDSRGRRTAQAGVPPDYFSAEGQLWGNPLYRWRELERTGFEWWIARLGHALRRFDAVRLDHFIGFYRYWEVPAGAKSAKIGRFVLVPGEELFRALRRKLGGLPFIAEDLGLVTPEVLALREKFHLPGMKVLQFGFGPGAQAYQPHRYERETVVYTGTHDNDTLMGWLTGPLPRNKQTAQEVQETRAKAFEYLGTRNRSPHWDFLRLCLGSVANTAIFPIQDVLGLGREARFNVPGTPNRNWLWRLAVRQLSGATSDRLRGLTDRYERAGHIR